MTDGLLFPCRKAENPCGAVDSLACAVPDHHRHHHHFDSFANGRRRFRELDFGRDLRSILGGNRDKNETERPKHLQLPTMPPREEAVKILAAMW